MTLWIAWSVLISGLLAVAAAAIERVAAFVEVPRRWVWMGAMAAATVIPVAFALRLAPPVAPPPLTHAPVISASSRGDAIVSLGPASARVAGERTPKWRQAIAIAPAIFRRADQWVVLAWGLISLTLASFFAHALVGLRREQSQWSDTDAETCRVLVAPNAGPAVVGILRPRIVVPQWTITADDTTRALLLRHEREHIRAGDSRVLFAAAVLLILFPWNGALWYMARRLRLAIEIDCDARVIRAVGGVHAYGLVLLAVGERYVTRLPFATSLSEPRLNLEARINAMTAPPRRRPAVASLPFVAIALGVLATVAWAPRPNPLTRARAQVSRGAEPLGPDVQPFRGPQILEPVVVTAQPVAASLAVVESVGDPTPGELFDPKPLRGNPAPRFPEQLRVAGTEGHVLLTFSTDSRGVPDTATIQVAESTHDLFATAVRSVLPQWRFDSSGVVRLVFLFCTTDIEAKCGVAYASGVFRIDGVPLTLEPVLITAMPNATGGQRVPRPVRGSARTGVSLKHGPFNVAPPFVDRGVLASALTDSQRLERAAAALHDERRWILPAVPIDSLNSWGSAIATSRGQPSSSGAVLFIGLLARGP